MFNFFEKKIQKVKQNLLLLVYTFRSLFVSLVYIINWNVTPDFQGFHLFRAFHFSISRL